MSDFDATSFFLQLSTAVGAVVLGLTPGVLIFIGLRWVVERIRGK